MEKHGKSWALKVFSSVNVLQTYSMEQLVALGVSWVWLGLEGKDSQYAKLAGTNTMRTGPHAAVARHPRARFEHHRPRRAYAGEHRRSDRVRRQPRHRPPPVHAVHAHPRHAAVRRMRGGGHAAGPCRVVDPDIHGQFRFNFRHPHIKDGAKLSSCCAPFSAISRSTVRASCESSARCCGVGNGIRTTRIRESAPASPSSGQSARSLRWRFVGGAEVLPPRTSTAPPDFGYARRPVRRIRLAVTGVSASGGKVLVLFAAP